jgi:hypothetical protein
MLILFSLFSLFQMSHTSNFVTYLQNPICNSEVADFYGMNPTCVTTFNCWSKIINQMKAYNCPTTYHGHSVSALPLNLTNDYTHASLIYSCHPKVRANYITKPYYLGVFRQYIDVTYKFDCYFKDYEIFIWEMLYFNRVTGKLELIMNVGWNHHRSFMSNHRQYQLQEKHKSICAVAVTEENKILPLVYYRKLITADAEYYNNYTSVQIDGTLYYLGYSIFYSHFLSDCFISFAQKVCTSKNEGLREAYPGNYFGFSRFQLRPHFLHLGNKYFAEYSIYHMHKIKKRKQEVKTLRDMCNDFLSYYCFGNRDVFELIPKGYFHNGNMNFLLKPDAIHPDSFPFTIGEW